MSGRFLRGLLVVWVVAALGYFVLNFAWKTVDGEPQWLLRVDVRGRGGPIYQEFLLVSSHPYITGMVNRYTKLMATNPGSVWVARYQITMGPDCTYSLPVYLRDGDADLGRLKSVLDTHLGSWVPPAGWERYDATRHYRATAPSGGAPAVSVHVTASLFPVYSSYRKLVRFPARGNGHPPLREVDVVTLAQHSEDPDRTPSQKIVQRADAALGWLEELGFLWAREDGQGLEDMVLLWPLGGREVTEAEFEAVDAKCRSGLAERLEGSPIYQLLSRGAGGASAAPPA